jgi:hypothetical protein
MVYITQENMIDCVKHYAISLLETPKDQLKNHSLDFTGALEKRAIAYNKDYLGSCGRFLTHKRVSLRIGNEYYGS